MPCPPTGTGQPQHGRKGRPLRVCHLGKFYPPAAGGMEAHVRTLARAQADLGAAVDVLCTNHVDRRGRDVTWRQFAAAPTVATWDGPVRVTRLGRCASVARLEVCPGLFRRLSRLGAAGTDVVHLHVPNPAMLLALAVTPVRVPVVVTYHSDVVRQKLLAWALRPFEHRVLRGVTRILSNSPTYQAGSLTLQRYVGKLIVLPMGIDLGPYLRPSAAARAHAERLSAEHGFPLWLTVGRLVYYKGLHHALEALARVPGKLLIIGTGPLEQELRRRAGELSVADRVVWCGHLDAEQVVGAYHAATALWFPSNARSEGFGLVQVEAMASGCPVINTAVPASGVAWVSRHEETGLTVPVNDSAALAAAAGRLLAEPGLRGRLADRARQRAQKEFDHRLMAERSLAIYRQVLTGAPVQAFDALGEAA
ncbi:MAG TPA: glycosyltransferase [Gemmataceae bacterium]|jgi:rhamnosyl/mannosyltransferase|nr:glycosyltransferase [Gemmataceae bacterium]